MWEGPAEEVKKTERLWQPIAQSGLPITQIPTKWDNTQRDKEIC